MSIADNLAAVEALLVESCKKTGRSRHSVLLVAVSKTMPVEAVAEAVAAGQRHFGENKVQELVGKRPAFGPETVWHLIGPLQSNKVRKALACYDWLHTLDSVELGERIDRIAREDGRHCRALLQVNISSDDAKHGIAQADAARVLDELMKFPQIRIEGLMTIPRFDPDPEKIRKDFARLRELRDQLTTCSGLPLPELSMGMSHDFQVAIEEGATIVRIGTSIFGERNQPTPFSAP